MSDLTLWLESLGLEKYGDALTSHDVDLTVAPDLTDSDLEKLGFSLGHRRKFLAAAANLRSEAVHPKTVTAFAGTGPAPGSTAQGHSIPTAERRQMTVAFVDLVDSIVLGGMLDPEDLIALLRRYRETCLAAI